MCGWKQSQIPKSSTRATRSRQVTSTTICGSDLHIYDGYIPTMQPGDIIGHEFMGEVVEVGSEVKRLKTGDRTVVSSAIGCGHCWYCKQQQWSLCDNSNPNGWMQEKVYGYGTGAIFGYSHAFGGYADSFADYIRVPFADFTAISVPKDIPDEKLLPVSDAFPTGYMGADLCNIQPGDVVAVWGCGPVGLIYTSTMDLFRRWSRATFSGMNLWEKSLKSVVKLSELRLAIGSSIHFPSPAVSASSANNR
ncbi:alcohol dehydrogenase GroES domain protein [Scytonema sp. HK-05]|nr:alcohol dehydrogenase GroES domain protein [Scytonema sp. HK-05]